MKKISLLVFSFILISMNGFSISIGKSYEYKLSQKPTSSMAYTTVTYTAKGTAYGGPGTLNSSGTISYYAEACTIYGADFCSTGQVSITVHNNSTQTGSGTLYGYLYSGSFPNSTSGSFSLGKLLFQLTVSSYASNTVTFPLSAGSQRIILIYVTNSNPSTNKSYFINPTNPTSMEIACYNPCTALSGVTASSNTTACGSASGTLTASYSSGTAPTAYQWQSSTNNSTWSSISGATSKTYSYTATQTTYYKCLVTNCSGTVTSNTVTITVNPLPAEVTLSTESGANTICYGDNLVLSATNGGDGTIYYQGTTSNGTSTATPSTSQTVTASGTYYFRAKSSAGCWGTQGSIAITVDNPELTISGNSVICEGSTTPLTATSGFNSYQWEKDGTDISGATLNTLTVSTQGNYSVTAINANNCSATSSKNMLSNPIYKDTLNGFNTALTDTIILCAGDSYNITDKYGNVQTATVSGVYTAMLSTVNGCDSVVNYIVTVLPVQERNLSAEICLGDTYTYRDSTITPETGVHNLSWIFTNGAACDSIIHITLTVNNQGTVTITGYDDNKCALNETVLNANIADSNVSMVYTFQWYENGTLMSGKTNSQITVNPTTHTTYKVEAISEKGDLSCTTQASVLIRQALQDTVTVQACGQYSWNGETYTENCDTTKTFSAINGCDSIVTLRLTLLKPDTTIFDTIVCDEFVWNGFSYTTSDIIQQTFANQYSCDSTVIINLTVKNATVGTDTKIECAPYIWIDGNSYTSSTTSPTFTIPNYVGCDSLITLNLTILQSDTLYLDSVKCEEFSWNGQIYTTTDTISQSMLNANGCDSTVFINLTINHISQTTLYDTICAGNDYLKNGFNIPAVLNNIPGLKEEKLTTVNQAGCDSTVTLYLTVKEIYNTEFSHTTCFNYSWAGETYTESCDTMRVFPAANGCDSTVILHLTIRDRYITEFNVNSCVSYTWAGETYTESCDTTRTFTASDLCDSAVTLHLVIQTFYQNEFTEKSCDSYSWNGETYTESCDTTKMFLAVNGCDSIVTLHLTIHSSATHEFTVTACDSYSWNDSTYSVSGDYQQKFQTVNGCDSTVTLHLTIHSSATNEFTRVTCDSYSWNDSTYSVSGDYQQKFNTVNGCDSIVTLHLTVNSILTHEFTEIACNNYSWNDSTYSVSGDYQQKFQIVNGCDSIVTLHLTIHSSATHEFTITACDSYSWNGQNYTVSGDYQQKFQTVNGCDSTVTLHLTIHSSATNEFTITVCDSYSWNGQTYTVSGNYTQNLQTVNGCDSIVTLHLTVNKSMTATDIQTACKSYTWIDGNTYTTTTNTPTFILTTANGCDSLVTLNLTIYQAVETQYTEKTCGNYLWNGQTYTESGDYTQKYTTVNGCDSTVILHLTINHPVQTEFSIEACNSYIWNNENYIVSGDYTRQYTTVNGCDSTVILHLTIHNSAETHLYATACDVYEKDGKSYIVSGDYITAYQTVNGCDSTVILHLIINNGASQTIEKIACREYQWMGDNYTESGIYYKTIPASNGCDSVITLDLTIVHSEVEIEEVVNDICNMGEVILRANTDMDNIVWNTGETTHEIAVRKADTYFVTATTDECWDTASYKIQECDYAIYIPNTFTPDIDGTNDYFSITIPNETLVKEMDFSMYNRSGSLVYKSLDPYFKWDGKVFGKLYRNTVYSYVLKITFNDGRGKIYKGTVTVL